jgi:6-pyruvoyltetrahydropterin/6-carboxytetrahydropterin synthase
MHFSSAHFVSGIKKCERLHGHNYTVEVFITGPLDVHDMVLDFREVKDHVIKICKYLDHKLLLPAESSKIKVRDLDDTVEIRVDEKRYILPKEDCLILPISATTVEKLAEYIAGRLEVPETHSLRVCVSESPGSVGCYDTKT